MFSEQVRMLHNGSPHATFGKHGKGAHPCTNYILGEFKAHTPNWDQHQAGQCGPLYTGVSVTWPLKDKKLQHVCVFNRLQEAPIPL